MVCRCALGLVMIGLVLLLLLFSNQAAAAQDTPTASDPLQVAMLPVAKNTSTDAPSPILAGPMIRASLPQAPDKIRGFTVDIVADGSGAIGYLPVQIQVKSTSTFSADRKLIIRFEPVELGQSPPQNGISCDIPITAPQGLKDVIIRRHLPKWAVGNAYQIRLFEDGVELEDYAQAIGTLLQRNSQPPMQFLQDELTLNWLYIDDEPSAAANADAAGLANETSQANSTVPQNSGNFRAFRQLLWFGWKDFDPLTSANISGLSDDWRNYQGFDGVLVSLDELEKLSNEYPGRFQALRDWVMAGGTLVIMNAGPAKSTLAAANFQSREEYVESRRIRRLKDTTMVSRNERRKALSARRATIQAIANGVQQRNPPQFAQMTPADAKMELRRVDAEITKLAKSPPTTDRIWSQPVAAGRVLGITGTEPIDDFHWSMVVASFEHRKSSALRRGVDPILGDPRARRWLIPGVAQPPVYTFMGLLTVFVILVGPIAYRRTTRVGRGYLMFAIAPMLALMTTVAMFTYGVVADGFGTTTRIRQLTWVDGRSGDAIERVRSTYFAGVRPADGLRFGPDAEVMAYPDNDGVSWEELNEKSFAISGKVDIRDDAQVFDSSFLPSRTQRQFIVHQPRHQLGKLYFHPPAASDSSRGSLENGFQFQLRNVIVRDQNGLYWSAKSIQPGQSGVSCSSVSPKIAETLLSEMYNRNRPLAEIRRRRSSSYDRRVSDLIMTLNRVVGESQLITDGVFETWLQKNLQLNSELPHHWFIAESDVSDDVVAVKDAELVESVRFVFGTLP